ncbi:MAG: VWA domain-containing protein [Acidobacteriota bacterium]
MRDSASTWTRREQTIGIGSVFWAAAVLLVGVLLTLSVPASAQEPEAPAISETYDVRVVNVEAVVTDRQGNRIMGLGPEDFTLLVDGQEVDVDYFSEIRGGRALDEAAASIDADPIAGGEAVGTNYLVFIDNFFTIKADRQRVLRDMQEQLGVLQPEDRMAIVSWDGRGLAMHSSWTGSERALWRAFTDAMSLPARGLEREAELRQFEFASFGTLRRFTVAGRRFDITERAYADRLTYQVNRLVDSASATLRSFANPEGRKVMLLVSGGWPYGPADFAAGNTFDAQIEGFFDSGDTLYGPLVETANLVGYTLYPIDAPGVDRDFADASLNSFQSARRRQVSFFREWDRHTSLRYLAQETGGRALIDGARTRGLESAYEDTRSYYWLGFDAERLQDGRRRSIELRVDLPKVKVRTRSGYTDLSSRQEVALSVESALLFGNAPVDQTVEIELGQGRDLRWGKVEVPLTVRIPVEQLALFPVADGQYVGEVEIRLAVKDGAGNRSEIPAIPLRFERSGAKDGVVEYTTTLKMRDRKHDLAVAVYEPASGRIFSTLATVGP